MPASPIIEIKNLSAGYDNRTVLHNINQETIEKKIEKQSDIKKENVKSEETVK